MKNTHDLEIEQTLMRERVKQRGTRKPKLKLKGPARPAAWERMRLAERRLFAFKLWLRGHTAASIAQRVNLKFEIRVTAEAVEKVIAEGWQMNTLLEPESELEVAAKEREHQARNGWAPKELPDDLKPLVAQDLKVNSTSAMEGPAEPASN
jgi:hypothetical protein